MKKNCKLIWACAILLGALVAPAIMGNTALAAPPTIGEERAETTTFLARIFAKVDWKESRTNCQLEYVTDTGYNSSAPNPYGGGAVVQCPFNPVEGDRTEIVMLSGLMPGTTYHFRVKATSADGTEYGPDTTFETKPSMAPTIEGESAVAAARPVLNVILGATCYPNFAVTTYYFQYGTDLSYDSGQVPAPAGMVGEEASIFNNYGRSLQQELAAGLSYGVTYHYRAVATSAAGTTYGPDQTFTTPPPPPVVNTGIASGVSPSSENVNGSVNPEGLDTHYYYQYGLTDEYGQSAPAAPGINAGSGSSDVPAPASLLPLTPGVTYHYRLVATNEDGISYGQDETFTTVAYSPPGVSTGSAGGVSVNAATISGTIDPQGIAASYRFEYGTDTGYGTQTFGTASPDQGVQTVTLNLRGIEAGTTYHYRLVASNPGGTTVGEDATFTTPGIASPIIPPSATPLIAIPSIAFPPGISGTTTPKALTKAQKLAAALKACAKKPRSKRAACRVRAHKRYRPTAKKKK